MSFCLLCKIIKIKTYKTVVLSVVSYGCETRSVAVRGRGSNRRLEESANEEFHDIAGVVKTGMVVRAELMTREGEKRNSHSLDQHVNKKKYFPCKNVLGCGE